MQLVLRRAGAIEVLARREQALHQKCRFDQVAGVIEHAKHGQRLACVAIHEVRPGAVVARRLFQEGDDLRQPLEPLIACDETAINADDNCHNAETTGTGGYDPVIARYILQRHSGLRVRTFPVIAKTGFLQHREQLFIAHRFGRGAGLVGHAGQSIFPIGSGHLVARGQSRLAEIIRKSIDA